MDVQQVIDNLPPEVPDPSLVEAALNERLAHRRDNIPQQIVGIQPDDKQKFESQKHPLFPRSHDPRVREVHVGQKAEV